MALSNITREPRREITEQLVGLLVAVAVIGADYAGVRLLGADKLVDIVVGMLIGVMAVVTVVPLGWIIMLGVHELGEVVCEALGRFDPRPRQRYR